VPFDGVWGLAAGAESSHTFWPAHFNILMQGCSITRLMIVFHTSFWERSTTVTTSRSPLLEWHCSLKMRGADRMSSVCAKQLLNYKMSSVGQNRIYHFIHMVLASLRHMYSPPLFSRTPNF
jgi:hypothetical protein